MSLSVHMTCPNLAHFCCLLLLHFLYYVDYPVMNLISAACVWPALIPSRVKYFSLCHYLLTWFLPNLSSGYQRSFRRGKVTGAWSWALISIFCQGNFIFYLVVCKFLLVHVGFHFKCLCWHEITIVQNALAILCIFHFHNIAWHNLSATTNSFCYFIIYSPVSRSFLLEECKVVINK